MKGFIDLSVIIVNYNSGYFLEQCLFSLNRAIGDLEVEIMIIDNHSPEGSPDYLQTQFPFARFISNTENIGFARANNQGLKEATGEFVLFLNPDTILGEDSLNGCIHFLRSRADVALTGVRMLDGSGRFLKESKRGFPKPWVSFCKMTGLTALFPRSSFFAAYYLAGLPEDKNNPVAVLSGAFMLGRRTILQSVGGFDERFFMYAEDIDLSFRIQAAGYINFYLADPAIIHFKGESTKKDARYIRLFYKAMVQFIRKHFNSGISSLYVPLISLAVRVREAIGLFSLWIPKPKSIIKDRPYFLTGDPDTVLELKERLNRLGRVLASDAGFPAITVYCQGPLFSFRQIIQSIATGPSGDPAMIHARGSASIVGSQSGNSQGEIIAL